MRQKTADKREKKSKEVIKRYNIFLTGRSSWLEGYCTFLLFSDECYPRPCASVFSGEASNKFAFLRTVPRLQYFDYVLSISYAAWFPPFHPPQFCTKWDK